MIDRVSGSLTTVETKLSSRCVRGASALALGAMLVTWSGVALAQTPSATSVELAGTTNVPTDPTKYNIAVSCTVLTAEEECRVTFADNVDFAGASTVSGGTGVRTVEVPSLLRTKTYHFFTNSLRPVGKGKSATVSASGASSVVSYRYGQALPVSPPAKAVSTPTPAPVVPTSPTAPLPTVTKVRSRDLGGRTCELVPGVTLLSNAIMAPGSGFASPNGKYTLRFEIDGRLRVVENATSKIVWEIYVPSSGPQQVTMHGDGSLKVTNLDGSSAWATPTKGNNFGVASLLDNGDLVIYPSDTCKELWSALKSPTLPPSPPTSTPPTSPFGESLCGGTVRGTTLKSGYHLLPGNRLQSPGKRYELMYQTDGDLVVYQLALVRKAVWSSKTSGTAPSRLEMQTSGVVVATTTDGKVAWKSSNAASQGAVLSMQDDGNLVVYVKDSCTPLWASK